MTTCTPIFGLPVIEGSDDPCDLDDWSCDFVTALDGLLDSWDDVIAHTFSGVPSARLEASSEPPTTTTVQVDAFNRIVFTEVNFDTDSMANLADPSAVLIPRRDGYYWVEARASSNVVGQGFSAYIQLNAGGETPGQTEFDGVNNSTVANSQVASVRKLIRWVNGGSQADINVVEQSSPSTLNGAFLSIYWHADL